MKRKCVMYQIICKSGGFRCSKLPVIFPVMSFSGKTTKHTREGWTVYCEKITGAWILKNIWVQLLPGLYVISSALWRECWQLNVFQHACLVTWPEEKTWTFSIHTLYRREAEILEGQSGDILFLRLVSFQALLVDSASKPPDSRGNQHNFLLGNFKLCSSSLEERKTESLWVSKLTFVLLW